MQDLMEEASTSEAPHHAFLDLGGGRGLVADKLETSKGNTYNVIMGLHLLHKYKAVVDYAERSVTFRVDGRHVKVDLGLHKKPPE